jgi:hypothetical protein
MNTKFNKCKVFDRCHKITVVGTLHSINTGMNLLVENGLATKKLMGFAELNQLHENEEKKDH